MLLGVVDIAALKDAAERRILRRLGAVRGSR
jgi:hypothetical protein